MENNLQAASDKIIYSVRLWDEKFVDWDHEFCHGSEFFEEHIISNLIGELYAILARIANEIKFPQVFNLVV